MVSKSYKASAPGSLMLCGEHAVLRGSFAIVCAMDKYITVTLTPRTDNLIDIHSALGQHQCNLKVIKIVKPFQFVLTAILQYQKSLFCGFDLEIKSDFTDQIGLGSSAAVTVATVSVLAKWLQQETAPLQLFKTAKKIILQVQGVGSGADVAASVFHGTIAYKIQPLTIKKLAHNPALTVIYSGSKTPTVEVIQKVNASQKKYPKKFTKIFAAINNCTAAAVETINAANWPQLGELMNIHQGLQEEMGTSNAKLKKIINDLRQQPNIFGAKISGSGLGDCVIGLEKRSEGYAFTPINIALCKYWGKRNTELNLPVTSSLSVTLGEKGALTRLTTTDTADEIIINNKLVTVTGINEFLDRFRPKPNIHYKVVIDINIPVAAGLASSACIYASLVKALNNLYNWQLDETQLSILARLGSGSACRSLWNGFVEWEKGEVEDGTDSHGYPLAQTWPELRIGIHIISMDTKPISSREAMQQTVATSSSYISWPDKVAKDMANIKRAIAAKDFNLFGKTVEANAIAMHATMADAMPPIIYALPETIAAMKKVRELRKAGMQIYFTQDAGPNLKLLFLEKDTEAVRQAFPDIEILALFADPNTEQVILVDKNDNAIGVAEKMAVHQKAQLHRAFSIFIYRKKTNTIEILLQQRQQDKYHCGGLWSNTCCSHPRPNEDIFSAAQRRLQEEMGFVTNIYPAGKFQYIAKFPNGLTENELDHVLIGTTYQQQFQVNPKEVQNYKWMALSDLQNDLQQNPQHYTPWLAKALDTIVPF